MDNIKYISKEIWLIYAKQYVIQYIAQHKVYRWIDENYDPVDHSGIVEEVPMSELKTFLEKEEIGFRQESYLDCLYNGEKWPSYESGCGWYYKTFQADISDELEQDFMEKMWQLNVPAELIDNDEFRDNNFDDFQDDVIDTFSDWLEEIYSYFTKERVMHLILKHM